MTARNEHVISAEATLQQIEKIHQQILKLEALRIEAEEQLLHRVGNNWRAGRFSAQDLAEIQGRYKATEIPGRSARWDRAVPIPWQRFPKFANWKPNGPAGTWIGEWPLVDDAPTPSPFQSVVYVLFDAASEPIYLGSTGAFRSRLKNHAKDGKPFVRWQAYGTADREAAYDLEVRLLREHKLQLNKRAGR